MGTAKPALNARGGETAHPNRPNAAEKAPGHIGVFPLVFGILRSNAEAFLFG
jgi:hypothetical protein